jgi:hypothetical protein
MDKDGDTKEPMKTAAKAKSKGAVAEAIAQVERQLNEKYMGFKEDTRLAMRRGPGADMIRYEKDSPAPGAKKHRDDTAKAAKELRTSGKKLGDQDEAKVGDKTVMRYNRDQSVKEGTGKCNESAKGKMCPVHGLKECGSMNESAKPDYIDLDKDGDKEESMKDAADDAEQVDEAVAVNGFHALDTLLLSREGLGDVLDAVERT